MDALITRSISKQARLPSFSIVIETDNLNRSGTERLFLCLESLAAQKTHPSRANEVLLVESGKVPEEVLEHIRRAYPWLTIHRLTRDEGYYEAKMVGAAHVTGDVVVFCDSDCRYEPQWLSSILASFSRRGDVHIVAGETTIEVHDSYSLAIALSWGFPTYSRRTDLHAVGFYAANNVAFRRSLLVQFPIPCELPLYRLKCAAHAVQLRRNGCVIWKQDQAKNLHPLPAQGLNDFCWRYLIAGHDAFLWQRYTRAPSVGTDPHLVRDLLALVRLIARWIARPILRLPRAVQQDPRRIVFLPLAIPIVGTAISLLCVGFLRGWLYPDGFLTRGISQLEGQRLGDGGQ